MQVFYCVDSKWPIIYIFFYEKQKAISDKIIHKTISINKMYYIILLVGSSLPLTWLQEGSCLIYVICVCLVRLYPLLGCRRAHVLLTWLQEGSCLIYVICVCLVRLYPLLGCRRAHVFFMLYVFVWFVFTPYLVVGGLMSYLWYMCLLFIVVSNTYILYICVTWRVSYKRQ